MNRYEDMSFCGIYCGNCRNYKKNMDCAGCKEEPLLIADCKTRVCAAGRGYLHCGECDAFPCADLEAFYQDGNPLHLEAYHNILAIREVGIEKWLEEKRA